MSIVQTATNAFKQGLMSGTYNLGSDAFKIALYNGNANLNADTAAYTSNNEVVATGYNAGGQLLNCSVTPVVVNNIAYVSFSNVTWNAALTARAALIYRFNGTTNPSVCVLDFGSDKTSTATFTVQFPVATNNSAIIRIV
jgi:hypothetical protein